MFDLIKRALWHPLDYRGFLHKRTLMFNERQHEGDGYYSFIFTPIQPCTWQAGQHGILFLPTSHADRGWRPFSVASSAHEGVIKIGTTISEPHSEFKESLWQLQPGALVDYRGPFGELHPPSDSVKIVGVAGGIGITPFRSIAYEIVHGYLPHTTLDLIYAAENTHPYQIELNAWQNNYSLNITYVQTAQEARAALTKKCRVLGDQAHYYLSGSPGMIEAVSKYCNELGVKKIISDPFKGY